MTNTILRRRILIAGGGTAVAGLLQSQTVAPKSDAEGISQLKPETVKEFVSVSHAKLDAVRELAQREPMLIRASWDWGKGDWETGLGAASHMGRPDIARFLIDAGARVDVFAVCMLGETAAAKALLIAFPDIHKTPGPHGIPLLTHAIYGRTPAMDVFYLLLDAGADINAASWRGAPPLINAVMVDEVEMVRELVDRGADQSAKTPAGQTAMDVAQKKGNAAIIEILKKA